MWEITPEKRPASGNRIGTAILTCNAQLFPNLVREGYPTTRPECGDGGWPAALVQARYTAACKFLVDEPMISAELNNL